MVRVPMVKFFNYMISYFIFLMLLFIDVNQSTASTELTNRTLVGSNGVINILILFYVIGKKLSCMLFNNNNNNNSKSFIYRGYPCRNGFKIDYLHIYSVKKMTQTL